MNLKLTRKTMLKDLLDHRSPGQVLVIVALAMAAMLLAAGLATDTGYMMMRKAQLERAVDAAALAGVVDFQKTRTLASANRRGTQIMAANGITLAPFAACPASPGTFWDTNQYCGMNGNGKLPGAVRYNVEAHWDVPLFFMPAIGFRSVEMSAVAAAEYFAVVDTFAMNNDQGLLQASVLEQFGPNSCIGNGDAYTPQYGGNGCTSAAACGPNPYYNDYSPSGAYTFRIAIPNTYARNLVRVELFDPQIGNKTDANIAGDIYSMTGVDVGNVSCTSGQRSPCLNAITGNPPAANNRFWFNRVDEGWAGPGCQSMSGYDTSQLGTTRYRLYYYQESVTGSLAPVDLAYYQPAASGSDTNLTGMKWVSPGGTDRMRAFTFGQVFTTGSTTAYSAQEPVTSTISLSACNPTTGAGNPYNAGVPCRGNYDFVVNLDDAAAHNGQPAGETSGIYVDPNSGIRHLYLEVRGVSGGTENAYSLWAGPTPAEAGASAEAPVDINARHAYVLNQRSLAIPNIVHSSEGIAFYGMGRLPFNSLSNNARVEFPLAYLGPEFAGLDLTVRLWDGEVQTVTPLIFYFDTIPQYDWSACYGTGQAQCQMTGQSYGQSWFGNNASGLAWLGDAQGYQTRTSGVWSTFSFKVPSETAPSPMARVPFYGGRLMVSYEGGHQDTYGWTISVEGRPALTQ